MALTRTKSLLLATTACGVLWGAPARAQSADVRMNAIEAQIRALQTELQSVRRSLRDAQAQAHTAQAQAHTAQAQAAQARTQAAQARTEVAQQAPRNQAVAQGGAAGASRRRGGRAAEPARAACSSRRARPGASGGGAPSGQTGSGGAVEQQQSGQATGPMGTFRLGGVTVQLGGFIEAAGIARSRNEVADVASSFSGIPLLNSPQAHESEFRGTAHQSRLSLLVKGDPTPEQHLAAYFETDFQGTGPSSNSNESNSYNLRLRQAYATYDNDPMGLHVLGGQAWSLLTMFRNGITPRGENIPLTIDAQYVVGFNWARQAQIRVAKDFDDKKIWLAASLEEPQTTYSIGPNGAGTVGGTANYNNPGGSGLNSGNNYSDDIAPDLVVKAAWDPGYGHYEAYGVGRIMHDRVSALGAGSNNNRIAGGGGVAALVPIIPKVLDVQGSMLAGVGIGRYGSGQLPDATLSASGHPVPLPEIQALLGVVGHPVPTVDVYGYVGAEQILSREAFTEAGKGYGYGSPLYNNGGCSIELAASTACVGNTSGLVEGTLGAWWRFLKGPYGTMQVGAQYEYVVSVDPRPFCPG